MDDCYLHYAMKIQLNTSIEPVVDFYFNAIKFFNNEIKTNVEPDEDTELKRDENVVNFFFMFELL